MLFNLITNNMSQPKTSLRLSNSEVKNTNDCVVSRRAVKIKTLADLSEKRNQGRCIGAFRSILILLFLFFLFFSFCYRRYGSAKAKLVLNFSMELNSVYTIHNCKVFI